MPRKAIAKPYNNGTWTHARFFGFLRSGLRRMSVRWAPQQACKQAARRAYTGSNKRQRWEYQCAECGGWFAGKDVAAHHKVPCGTLKDWGDIEGFARRLFCEVDGFEVVCDDCHKEGHNDKHDGRPGQKGQ